MLPMVALAAIYGGWALLLVPLTSWWLFSILDLIIGIDRESLDPETADAELFWHRFITLIWPALQAVLIFGTPRICNSNNAPRGVGEDRPFLRCRRRFGYHRHRLLA